MKSKLIIVLNLLSLSIFAQVGMVKELKNQFDGATVRFSGWWGPQFMVIPSRNNVIEKVDGVDKKLEFSGSLKPTIGFDGGFTFTPLQLKNFSYSLNTNQALGWLLPNTSSSFYFGHSFSLILKNTSILFDFDRYKLRSSANNHIDYIDANSYNQIFGRSRYNNFKRSSLGFRYLNSDNSGFEVKCLFESYSQGYKSALGLYVSYLSNNKYLGYIEVIPYHPERGVMLNGAKILPGLPDKAIYLKGGFRFIFDKSFIWKQYIPEKLKNKFNRFLK